MFAKLGASPSYFLQPVRIIRAYHLSNLRLDLVAGLTVAVVLIPQAIAYAFIAELPPQVGLYTAIMAALVGALWGSSHQLHTGPTNAISLLVFSALVAVATPGTIEFLVLAGLLAVIAGVIQLALGLARLGVLVNFVSHSVIVGFSSGAGVLIAIKQLRHLFGLEFTSHNLAQTIQGILIYFPELNKAATALGLGTILLIVLLRRLNPKLPGPLISMVLAAAIVGLVGPDRLEVAIIGELPVSLPPLARLPLLDLSTIAQLSTAALAIAAIGLVEAISIARSIASQTGQRLDSNQEFVGQGLANIASGFFSGYPCSGSFTRSAVNYDANAQTSMSSAFSGLFVLIAMIALAPLAAFVPRTALSGVLIVTAYGMIDRQEIRRIWRGSRDDAVIMVVTFLGTLFLHLEFAVLVGILLSFAVYIMKTSVPEVTPVVPDDAFRHFTHQPQKPQCPQLAILDIMGDLYFGAVNHIEEAIHQHLTKHPGQRFVLLRMNSVDQCDFTGIHALESIVYTSRERGGDVFIARAHGPVLDLMESTGFSDYLGADHFLAEDEAITYLYHNIIDPVICIYECEARTFKECQNLPKQTYPAEFPFQTHIPTGRIPDIAPQELWQQLCSDVPPLVIDVREPREFRRGHIPQAIPFPLPRLLSDTSELPRDQSIVFVCRGGRRSSRAVYMLHNKGYGNVTVLRGGMLAWETAGLLEAVDEGIG